MTFILCVNEENTYFTIMGFKAINMYIDNTQALMLFTTIFFLQKNQFREPSFPIVLRRINLQIF